VNAQVRLATATTLRFQPREGRATTATITIKDSDDGDLVTAVEAASATVDPVTTTVDAACGVSSTDKRQVKLTSTTSIRVGGIYLITDSLGRTEWVEVQSITAGDYVTVKDDLVYDYADTNPFVGTELTYSLTGANAQNSSGECQADYRCEWTYVVSSVTYVRETLYDVTRHPWFRVATTAGLKKWNPDLFSLFDREEGRDWDDDLQSAFERIIERLDARGLSPNAILGMEKLEAVTYAQLVWQKGIAGVMPPYAVQDPVGYLDRTEDAVNKALDTATKNITWIDKDQDNAKSDSETGTALRVVRMTQ